eukprot:2214337-Rhodomonas_salina.2
MVWSPLGVGISSVVAFAHVNCLVCRTLSVQMRRQLVCTGCSISTDPARNLAWVLGREERAATW